MRVPGRYSAGMRIAANPSSGKSAVENVALPLRLSAGAAKKRSTKPTSTLRYLAAKAGARPSLMPYHECRLVAFHCFQTNQETTPIS